MKVGILTLHRANNYGAALQCYALQYALKAIGYESWIIDYRQPDTEKSYKIFQWNTIRQDIRNPRLLCKDLTIRPLLAFLRQRAFNHFRKRFHATHPIYKPTDMPQDIDVYLIGSDQLWSIQCMGNNIEPVYFGEFPHPANSRICGYAISSNIDSLEAIGGNKLCKYLQNFDVISMRENEIAEFIQKKTDREVRVDIDPTLLVDSNVWEALTIPKTPSKDKYVLTYFLLPEQKKYAEIFAHRLGLKLIEVGKVALSPIDFLTYIKHATYIIGGSFHIAVFSVIFRKQFFIIKKNSSFDVRSVTLLHNLHLDNHLIEAEELLQIDANLSTNFEAASMAILTMRKHSIEYLKRL